MPALVDAGLLDTALFDAVFFEAPAAEVFAEPLAEGFGAASSVWPLVAALRGADVLAVWAVVPRDAVAPVEARRAAVVPLPVALPPLRPAVPLVVLASCLVPPTERVAAVAPMSSPDRAPADLELAEPGASALAPARAVARLASVPGVFAGAVAPEAADCFWPAPPGAVVPRRVPPARVDEEALAEVPADLPAPRLDVADFVAVDFVSLAFAVLV